MICFAGLESEVGIQSSRVQRKFDVFFSAVKRSFWIQRTGETNIVLASLIVVRNKPLDWIMQQAVGSLRML